MAYVIIDMPSSQQQHSSDSMQNNNGDNRSLVSTGVGAQEKFVPIPKLLEKGASRLGVLVCGWVVLMLVQGGIFVTVETKDRVSVTVLFFLVCFRWWRYFYPPDTGSLTEATQSLSADNIQQLAIPIGFISRLFYWWNLVSIMTSVVLSMMRLASQDFSQTEANKGARDFSLNVFYGLAFAEALLLLIALTFVTIMAVQRKVTKVLIEWVKPSQPAQAPPTHQNTTLFERAKCQVHPNSVGYSHLPASEPHDSVKPSQLAQAPPTHQNTTLLLKAQFPLHPDSVGCSHLPESELHDLCTINEFSQLKSLLSLNARVLHLFPAVNLSTLNSNHFYFDECVICLQLIHNLRNLILSSGFWKEINKLIDYIPVCVPRSAHDLFRTINWRNLKYIYPSLEHGLRRRVSRPRQLLLKEDYSDDSEDNLPHLKAD
ncbi:uncharacterized protein LOC144566911 [Carex rostrata]